MANLGGDFLQELAKVAEAANKKAYGIPFGQQSDAPCAKCHQAIKPGEMTTNEGMGGAEQHVNCPWQAGMGRSQMPANPGQSAYASTEKKAIDEAVATDWAKVKQWMEANAREFDNATNLAESAAEQFNLYEGDFDIPVEVFDLAHEVMYDDNFDVRSNVMSDNHEFSDIGGAPKIDVTNAKTAEPEITEGEEVRGKLPSGAVITGEVEKIEGDQVTIYNGKIRKTVPMKDVTSVQSHEQVIEKNRRDDKTRREEEAQAEKGKKRDERIENSVSMKANGTPEQMASELQRRGYRLTLKYKAPEFLEQAEKEYADWTGGESISEDAAKEYATMYGREWTLVYKDPQRDMPVFFDIEPMGTHENKKSPTPIGLSRRDVVVVNYPEIIGPLVQAGLRMNSAENIQEVRAASASKKACGDCNCQVDEEVVLPAAKEVPEGSTGERQLPPAATKEVETDKEAGFNFFFPGQVTKEFYPEIQHEMVDYPNDNNSPVIEDIDIDNAIDTTKLSYVSTSPAGAMGIGRDGKPQILEGAPLRKENDIRGEAFLDEFHQQYEGVPAALLTVASKVAAKDEKAQFELFLKKVMAEIAAAFVAAYKVTGRTILNMVPGIGEVQLAQVEQPSSLSSFNIVNTGSRVKYLLDKLNDGDIREAVNKARAQAAVWIDDPNGGFVYEVFARAESIDTDTMIMKYTFIIGTKESE